MNNQKLVTIVIATFNSCKSLPKVLESISCQSMSRDNIEILMVDGGSSDNTRKIGDAYNARIINNPRTEPVNAKFLGYKEAKGDFIIYLDHDEVLENHDSIALKYGIITKNENIKAVIGSGYKNPRGVSVISEFINEFGDPFSFFMYRLSKSSKFFTKEMKKRYKKFSEDSKSTIFDFYGYKSLPIIELCAAGSMINAKYFKNKFPETLSNKYLIPHFFYLLIKEKNNLVAISNNDCLIHYSSDDIKSYLKKIQWRVKNNVYHVSNMGLSGFTGREQYQSFEFRIKKYLFIPYSLSIIFPFLDALYLIFTRQKLEYIVYVFLVFYTAILVLYHSLLKLLGIRVKLKSYDESIEIE